MTVTNYFALSENEKPVIAGSNDAQIGESFSCPVCEKAMRHIDSHLSAGRQVSAYFRHRGAQCRWLDHIGAESMTHLLAKLAIYESGWFFAKQSARAEALPLSPHLVKFFFESCVLEKRIENRVPDLIAVWNGYTIAVEVTCTSGIKTKKKSDLSRLVDMVVEVVVKQSDVRSLSSLAKGVQSQVTDVKNWRVPLDFVSERNRQRLRQAALRATDIELSDFERALKQKAFTPSISHFETEEMDRLIAQNSIGVFLGDPEEVSYFNVPTVHWQYEIWKILQRFNLQKMVSSGWQLTDLGKQLRTEIQQSLFALNYVHQGAYAPSVQCWQRLQHLEEDAYQPPRPVFILPGHSRSALDRREQCLAGEEVSDFVEYYLNTIHPEDGSSRRSFR
ncbi:hypothetical protein SAMN05444000_14211 [Shimia gijangensis]|uniref:Competence protein CoiA-like family protein n=1 Tax=Shimia gijangensis TaxID=1470563 RepID=A0A1M6TNM4_9RHOB|nr:hypothetical protein [Shimia gijangensis]SHK58513.1 hypothetical protein SAMN05444000_14211 [Shimia gijangensis]